MKVMKIFMIVIAALNVLVLSVGAIMGQETYILAVNAAAVITMIIAMIVLTRLGE